MQVTGAARITTGAWLPSHTGCVLLPQSVLQNMQTYFLLLPLHFLFSPFTIHTTAIPGSGTAEGFMWFKASPDKILPKHERCQGAEHSLSPSPRGSGGLGSRPAVTQRSCVNSEQAAGEGAPGESTGGGLAGHPSPLQGCIPAQTDPWPLSELCRFVCAQPFALLTQTLPWRPKFWCYLGVTHHHRVFWWLPGSWLTLTSIMDLVWLPYDSPPHWQDHCPACLAVTLSFQPAFFLPSNPLCAPWQVE